LTRFNIAITVFLLGGFLSTASAQFTQQGQVLLGAGSVESQNAPQFHAISSALSADGNTALIGDPLDNNNAGAAWPFVRTDGVWVQQGPKLVGSGAAGGAAQGHSVALSGDGTTALVGASGDNNGTGAAWVFTRSSGAWSQQGTKIAASGTIGDEAGSAVAISSDGNTAVVGAPLAEKQLGGFYVFIRQNGVWTQQTLIVGPNGVLADSDWFGYAVALSGDGNTIAVGAWGYNDFSGGTFVYTRTGNNWTQQGSPLVGSGAIGASVQGFSVSLSSDGNTLLVGAPGDNNKLGAAWVFARSQGVWSQQAKLVEVTGGPLMIVYTPPGFGDAVALSADGSTAVVGCPYCNNGQGAFRVFQRTPGGWLEGPSEAASGATVFGSQVAASTNGSTILAGGAATVVNGNTQGGTWAFVRTIFDISTSQVFVGVPFSFALSAVEADDNAPLAYSGTVSFSSSDPHASLPSSAPLSLSSSASPVAFQATLNTSGLQSITAADTSLVSGTATVMVQYLNVQATPSSLNFTYAAGINLSPAAVVVSANGPISLSASVAAPWLSVSGGGSAPASLSVKVNPAGLAAGTYNGAIALALSDGRSIQIPVTLTVTTQISIVAYSNSASFVGNPGAPNTLLSMFGIFPGCASGASANIGGLGTTVFASSPTQINLLIPSSVAGQSMLPLQIACNGLISETVSIPLIAYAPGVFTMAQSGAGEAAVVNQDESVGPPSPAGSIVTVYGTGFGVYAATSSDGLQRIAAPVTAMVGGVAATVLYAGEAPGYTPGLQQFNIMIPSGLASGSNAPLVLTVGGVVTQAGVFLAIR